MPPPRGKGKFSKDRKPKRNTQSLLFRRKRFCRFTVTGVTEIDYKDVDTLRDFIGENGKITPARLTGITLWAARLPRTSGADGWFAARTPGSVARHANVGRSASEAAATILAGSSSATQTGPPSPDTTSRRSLPPTL